jgi:hypothetical protein
LLACAATVLACTAPLSVMSDCDPLFTKANENGFGVSTNRYSWAMEVFEDRLYVGTINQARGAQIWRLVNDVTWQAVVRNGLTTPRNIGTRSMAVCNGRLYAGTDNVTNGAELWSTSDGANWTPILTAGGISPDLRSIRALFCANFGGTDYLYIGMMATTGAGTVLRTTDDVNFEQVTTDGFGRAGNKSIHTFGWFNGALYAATSNQTNGLQVWRTSDGLNFEILVGPGSATPGGFDHESSNAPMDFQEFNGRLFLGDINALGGFGLWATADGLTWTQIGSDGFGYQGNDYAWNLEVYENALWLGVLNSAAFFSPGTRGASLWRSFDGDNWEEMVGGPPATYLSWGFDNPDNMGIRTLKEYHGKLYIGTAQDARPSVDRPGLEIWTWPGEACPAQSAP